jgi:hypothetical protein
MHADQCQTHGLHTDAKEGKEETMPVEPGRCVSGMKIYVGPLALIRAVGLIQKRSFVLEIDAIRSEEAKIENAAQETQGGKSGIGDIVIPKVALDTVEYHGGNGLPGSVPFTVDPH